MTLRNFFPKVILIISLVLLEKISFGQNKKVIFYQKITGDSTLLFFNERYHYVEKKCAKYIRLIKLNRNSNFNGSFEDVDFNNSLLGKGAYQDGKRNGYFELYYPTGKMFCKGNYLAGAPSGLWDFYYENGLPERTIKFTHNDTLLVRFIDRKGNLKVIDGNGEFDGPVTGRTNSNNVVAKGRIVDGKPDGKWTSFHMILNTIFCREEFANGKFVKGFFPNAKVAGVKSSSTRSFLNTFLLWQYIDNLEKFFVEKCEDK